MKSSDELIANLKNMSSREVLLELLTTIKTQESEIVELNRVNKNQYKELEGKVEAIGRLLAVVDELEAKLENAIVPKFKIGQEVWLIRKKIISRKVSCIFSDFFGDERDYIEYGLCDSSALRDDRLFATEAEALASLETEGGK